MRHGVDPNHGRVDRFVEQEVWKSGTHPAETAAEGRTLKRRDADAFDDAVHLGGTAPPLVGSGGGTRTHQTVLACREAMKHNRGYVGCARLLRQYRPRNLARRPVFKIRLALLQLRG